MLAFVFYIFSIFFVVAAFVYWRELVQKGVFLKLDLISFSICFNVIFLISIPLLLFRFGGVKNYYFEGVGEKDLTIVLDWAIWVLCYFLLVFFWVSVQTTLAVRRASLNRIFRINVNLAGKVLSLF